MSSNPNPALVNGALRQDRLSILLALYDRPLHEVAARSGMSVATASRLVNCRYLATPAQVLRLEAAIIGVERLAAPAPGPGAAGGEGGQP